MRKAKIICTIGPASASRVTAEGLIRAGMDVARLNFSHGSNEEHRSAVNVIRKAARKYDSPVALLQDLRGLKIRVGALEGGSVMLRRGSEVTLTTRRIKGSGGLVPILYNSLCKDVQPGDRILLDDGLLRLRALSVKNDSVSARVVEGGLLKDHKGVNLPGTRISGQVFTHKDRQDLAFGIEQGVDYVAMSFVCTGQDILRVKKWIKKLGADIPVIAKIENRQALENIDSIIEAADGVMVARGDLGVELPPEDVPLIQKELIDKCNAAMKPVITATQMLESMTGHTTPTRAEAADVANAVIDGTDALMLSAETSVGRHPVEAVRMMDRIIRAAERPGHRGQWQRTCQGNFPFALAEAACASADDINARTIAAFSISGFTALLVSKFKPAVPVTVFTTGEKMRRKMNLYRGVNPYVLKLPDNTDSMIFAAENALLEKKIVRSGDAIVIIASSPFSLGGTTNIMKLHKVG